MDTPTTDPGRQYSALETWRIAKEGERTAWNELRRAALQVRNEYHTESHAESYDELLADGRTKDALAVAECAAQELSNRIACATSRKRREGHRAQREIWWARIRTLRAIVEDASS